jgi:ABC-type thiamine transport system ATPase subunit
MTKLTFDRVKYKTRSWVADFSVELESDRWYVVCGASGAGKSTFANLASGLLSPESGDIFEDGKSIMHLPPHQRKISLMGQYDGLFPGISISDNLHLSLHDSPLTTTQRLDRINNIIDSLSLDRALLTRMPSQLSGGQLSRCNLARTLLRPCQWLFLDEPFASVDRPTRLQILEWLGRWAQETRATIILITHDLDDVFTVATDVTVVDNGVIVDHASLDKVISEPKSIVSARLLRAGIIIHVDSRIFFVAAENLRVSVDEAMKIPETFRVSHVFKSPRATRVGPWMRIVDFADANDVTLPYTSDFKRTVWYDRRHQVALSK